MKYSAIVISLALGGIEALDSQNNAGSSRRRMIDAVPVEEPSFPPVDIRIPIGSVNEESPTKNMSPEESAPVQTQTDQATTNDNDSSESTTTESENPIEVASSTISTANDTTDNSMSTPSMPPTKIQPIENEPNNTPEETPKNNFNWCPTYFSGSDNSCGSDLPANTSWIQCAYSESNHLQTCICTDSDPFWRCKGNAPNSGAFGTATSIPFVESTTGKSDATDETPTQTPTRAIKTSVEESSSEIHDGSSSTAPVDSAGSNKVPDPSPNTGVTIEVEESPSQPSSKVPETSSNTPPVDSAGSDKEVPDSLANTGVTIDVEEPPSQPSSKVPETSSNTPPVDSAGSGKVPNPSPSSESNTVEETFGQSSSKGPNASSTTLPVDAGSLDKVPADPSPTTESTGDVMIDDVEETFGQSSSKGSNASSTTPPVDSGGTDKVPTDPSPTKESNTGDVTVDDVEETFGQSSSKTPNTPSTTPQDDSVGPNKVGESNEVSDPLPTSEPTTAYKQTNEDDNALPPTGTLGSPAIEPSLPPTRSSNSLTQKLPPGIFAGRTSPPTSLPTTLSTTKALHDVVTDASACRNASSSVERRKIIFQYLRSLSGEKSVDDTEHPTFTAGSWIADEDQLQVCPGDQNFIQRYVLALLYFSTSGDDWKRCTRIPTSLCSARRFLSAFNECNWGGVTCDSQNRITKLNLDENNMSGSIPVELKYLEHLLELDFDSNDLLGHFPSWVGSMKYLEKLDLDRNVLSGPIPEELYSSTSLKFIDMDRNILSGTISSNIALASAFAPAARVVRPASAMSAAKSFEEDLEMTRKVIASFMDGSEGVVDEPAEAEEEAEADADAEE